MRRLAALIIGVATAQPDIDAACRRRTYPDRYVVMLSAFEQMNKNIGVVAEVASWAKKLGRTFVEPMYCRWSYVTKEGDEYDCDHVAKKTKRCTTRFSEDGVRADDACKKTCGTC